MLDDAGVDRQLGAGGLGAEDDLLAGREQAGLVRDLAEPVAGPHEVEGHGEVTFLFDCHPPHPQEGLPVLVLGAVRQVEANEVDARPHQLPQHRLVPGGRPHRRHDLRPALHFVSLSLSTTLLQQEGPLARTLMMPKNLSAASTTKRQDAVHEILGYSQPLGRSQAEHPEDQGVVVLTGSGRPGLVRRGGGIVLQGRGICWAGLAHRSSW